ncbi:AC5 [Bhendi yellow vein Bhubhaneswar virus]|uniref:AC5 n=1 Tax=Bhendi yellow vein Bhubhaneswar virus TaxID=591160 RepID=B9VQ02_9GEMI|nr:AC5 [Bhendi yellow vein Bhubhaneswar virus]ACM45546.1 AC5 [Bhendi yellow vein Bhubhaneswar virus]
MSTCHIQQQSILSVIFILPSFLVIIHHIIVNTIKFPNYSLFLSSILTTCDCCLKPPQHLKTITLVVLHSSRRGLIIKHIEYFTKILWFICRTSITNKEKHNEIRILLVPHVLVHPYLT